MIFSFNTFNHCRQGQIIIEDITAILGHQIAALGHDVRWSNAGFLCGRNSFNVVLESFADDPETLLRIAAAHQAGCRFLCVATEEPTESGFNHGLEPAMVDRQNAFPEAARYFDGILHLVPGEEVTRWYSRFAPAAAAELGYSPTLVDDPDPLAPDHDFGFYGKMTWRREEMLARLAKLGSVLRIESLDVPRRARDATMRRARVIVQIRANEEWGAVSSSRCATALSLGRPVVAEPHPTPGPWAGIVRFSESVESFYEDAAAVAREWRHEHFWQLARFRERLSPEFCVGGPLRAIGAIP